MRAITMTAPQSIRREIGIDGRAVRLSPMQHSIAAFLLMQQPGRRSSPAELIEAVYPDPDYEADTAEHVIRGAIWLAKAKGVPISGGAWKGYELIR